MNFQFIRWFFSFNSLSYNTIFDYELKFNQVCISKSWKRNRVLATQEEQMFSTISNILRDKMKSHIKLKWNGAHSELLKERVYFISRSKGSFKCRRTSWTHPVEIDVSISKEGGNVIICVWFQRFYRPVIMSSRGK